jgi:hypothetical protein
MSGMEIVAIVIVVLLLALLLINLRDIWRYIKISMM